MKRDFACVNFDDGNELMYIFDKIVLRFMMKRYIQILKSYFCTRSIF